MSSKLLDLGKVPLRPKAGGNIWATLAQITEFLLVAAVVAAIFACFLPVIHQVQGLQEQKQKLGAQIVAEETSNRQLNRQFDLLRSNPEYIERIARDQLNMGKPGEVIFRFDPYSTRASAGPVMASPMVQAPASATTTAVR